MSGQKIMENLQRVFVYGTLKRGEPNHHWLTKAENGYSRFVAEAKTEKKFPLVVGTRYNIPFLLDRMGTGYQVRGEVFEVDSKMFASLDELEDYPNYYDRELQQVICENGTKMECWLYLLRNYPEKLLKKPHLETYHTTPELPYCESYVESKKDDIYEFTDQSEPTPA